MISALRRHTQPVLFFIGCLLISIAGCGDDNVTSSGNSNPTIENLWPNEDGREWNYASVQRFWNASLDSMYFFSDPDSVPPPPTFAEILPLILDPEVPDSVSTSISEFGLEFDGEITTASGVTAQNLVERFDGVPAEPFIVPGSPTPGNPMRSTADSVIVVPAGPTFLHGGAWEKTLTWIGGYADVDTSLAWLYLDAPIRTGRTFELPIGEATLHGFIWRFVNVETDVGRFDGSLEVAYILDLGVRRFPIGAAPFDGYFRMITYGTVTYAPTAGPVASYERYLVPVGLEGTGPGYGDRSLRLIGIQAGPPPQD